MRSVADRLRWGRLNPPGEAGWCARWVWQAINLPRQGLPDATAVYNAVPNGEMQTGPAPRGSVLYWVGGSAGHGHAALSAGDGKVMSVDVDGPGTVGVRPFEWFRSNWGNLRYKGWSWYFGALDTEIKEKRMARVVIKRASEQVIPLNEWVKADFRTGKGADKITPPDGNNDWDVYVHLNLKSVTGADRNDLRYIAGRWARHDSNSLDLIDMDGRAVDVTGADTKAIPPDLPKMYWRSTWTHGFVGHSDVPVSFWVYIGSMKDGTVVSPLRIFKVDDEA